MSTTTNGSKAPVNFETEKREPTPETAAPAEKTAATDSQGAEASVEKAPGAAVEKPKAKPPEKSDEFVDHFNRLVAEGMTEDAAAKDVLRIAKELAAKQADRAMHLTEGSKETINGALERIGATLAEGKENPLFSLADIVAEIKRLRDEHGDNLDRITGQSSDNDNDSVESK